MGSEAQTVNVLYKAVCLDEHPDLLVGLSGL
jgi:hypothetical protein